MSVGFVKVTEPVTGVTLTVSKESVQARLWQVSEPNKPQSRRKSSKSEEPVEG